jgi:hypothetical protein
MMLILMFFHQALHMCHNLVDSTELPSGNGSSAPSAVISANIAAHPDSPDCQGFDLLTDLI